MAAEVYLRDNLAQWRKAKEFYFHDGNEWRNIQEAYSYDGASWRKVFQYTAPSSLPSNPTGPIRPDVVASSGTYVSTYPLNPNNSKDTSNAVVDIATFGDWRVTGQTGNTVIWTWASGSNSYSTISLNVRLAVSNLTTATTTGTECAIYGSWSPDPPYAPECIEYRSTTIASPATIVFSYSLDGSTYTDFYTYSSLISETADGTISSGDITSGLGSVNSDLSNLKVKAAISCPTGASSNAFANLKVYDVWANTVAGASAVPPTVTFTASSSNVPNGTSVNLVSTFSGNGGATITSASINQGVSSIGTSSPVTTAVTPASTATTTYTLTVTDSNSNTTTRQVSVNAYAAGATSPTINLGSGAQTAHSVQLGTSVNLTATWNPGTAGQSVVSVTTGNATNAGLPSPWTPSSSPGYYTITPTAEGTYTITNTLNASTPTASAVLTVTAPNVAPIAIQTYYPSSKQANIYTDDDDSTFNSTSIKIWADYTVGASYVQGTVTAQWQYSTNNSTWSSSGSLITGILYVYPTEKVVAIEGYYRCVFTDTVGSTTVTTNSDSFYVSPRYRYKPDPTIYRSVDSIAMITRANPGVITLAQRNTSLNGKLATLSGISGMTQLNNQTVTLTDIGSGLSTGYSYSIGVNTSGYNDFDYYLGIAIVESISSWDSNSYTVDWKPISNITGYPTRTVTTTSNHGFSDTQKVLFTDIIGMTELNSQLLTISSAATNTFQVSLSGLSNSYVSGGFAIGADTSASAGATNLLSADDLIDDNLGYVTVEKKGLIKFPSILAYSAKIFIRAGWTYNGFADTLDNPAWTQFGIHDGAPTGQMLSMTLLKNGQGVTDLLNVLIPKDPNDGSTPSSTWSETVKESNYTFTLTGLTNLNEISIGINAIDSTYNRSTDVPGDPTDSHSGQINVYDVYVIYDKVSTVTNVDSDKIFP